MRNNIILTMVSPEKNQSYTGLSWGMGHHFSPYCTAFVLCPLRKFIYSTSYLPLALLVHLTILNIDGINVSVLQMKRQKSSSMMGLSSKTWFPNSGLIWLIISMSSGALVYIES